MNGYININSELDALKIKEIEKIFYDNIQEGVNLIPKVTPFKGINTDMLYIKDNKVLFIKFMDTTEDLFFILEEELLEVMNEENDLLSLRMKQLDKKINYNYIFIMPYVEIENNHGFKEFIENHIIDKNKLKEVINNKELINDYLVESNDEIDLNLYMLDICPEYYLLNDRVHLNKKFKKISFYNDDYKYSATMLDSDQLTQSISIKYGNTLFKGGSGTGKTTIMLSRAIKLSRLYPHHKFLILTDSKQTCNELREKVQLLYKNNNNLEIYTYSSFIFKLAKKYNLIVDYNMVKKDYEKAFSNLVKQAKNIIKNKNMFKGIFIDEVANFTKDEIQFIREFLYKTKFIFNVFSCESLNISNDLNIFKENLEDIEFKETIYLEKNYKQSKELVKFTNNFAENANKYINSLRDNRIYNKFYTTEPMRDCNKAVDIIKVSDLDEQISSLLWEIEYLINKKGLDYSEIGIIYPYNKKKLKNGKTIYFQYMLKKALEEAGIPYIYAEENLTNISKKLGVTISNIYTIKNLEYKALIVCELEMLYNHTINDKEQDYQINDFVGDLNKVYLAINRACDYLSIITTFNENSSDIIKLLMESK
ncbi:UvrD-helicase domain-containing protein [Romboutsia sp.]|uniref:UvrD-helicase domain-containing protein n=1 Tax=Romboutsia sp. TaxID=1965302 RepID=UPI002BD624D9|nr:UvrD-helicase domain-containing protein [Romboutsia sp.]HSQ87924.1 UvrD-helicase domain-containing protein [Romboutsia sp.]